MAVSGAAGTEFVERKEGNQVIHVRGDSDSLMNSLFDSVLKKHESTMPLQVPLSMRKLPKSFFNPPSHGSKSPSVSHSRTSSTDSTQGVGAVVPQVPPLHAAHMRAHSSPATLQQTYSAAVPVSPHVKQQSFDVLADGGGPMPPGWEQACTSVGQTYYINHIEKTTTWEDPRKKMHVQSPGVFHTQSSAVNGQQSPVHNAAPTSAPSTPQGAAVLSSQLQQLSVNNSTAAAAGGVQNTAAAVVTGPLPDGWVQAETEDGEVYFINHLTRTTTWFDPRIPERLQRPAALLNNSTAGAVLGSPQQQQLLQQRHQTLRVQQLKLESERLRICKRQVMKQWVQDGQSVCDEESQHQQLLSSSAASLDQQQRLRTAAAVSGGTKAAASLEPFLSSNGLDYHARQESADSGVGLNSNYTAGGGAHTPDSLLTPLPTSVTAGVVVGPPTVDDNMDNMDQSDATLMETPDLPTLDNMDSDDLVPSIQQLDGDGLMSEEILLNDVSSIINENRLDNNGGHTWI